MLEHFTGRDHASAADHRRGVLAGELGRGDLSVRSTSTGSALVLGSYADPRDEAAQRDLAWVRSLVSGGQRPFDRAFLVPPSGGERGSHPEFNLATVKTTRGSAAVYTLQIGVWELPDRTKARSSAERDVVRLRQEGHEAYYYHGPARSMVTIGVFSDADYDAVMREVAPSIKAALAAFPHNLLNGETYRSSADQQVVGSALVRIPD